MWLLFVTQYKSSLSNFAPIFRILNQVVAEKSLTEIIVHMYFIGVTEVKFENLEKEGTIHVAHLKVYINFENTSSNKSQEICDRNFHWREREMNK